MQQRNDYKTVQDFLADESFRSWIQNQDDATDWNAWTAENPQRGRLVEQARIWVLAMGVPETELSPAETRSALAQTWKKIHQAEISSPTTIPLWQRRVWRNVAAAAVLIIGLGTGLWFYRQPNQPVAGRSRVYEETVATTDVPLLERRNTLAKSLVVTLPDQSTVTLEPGGRLSYPARFAADSRTVYLSGDAFFTVTPNSRQPFLVFANETVTKVLGTSFRVNAQPQAERVTVQVRTGLVAVIPKAKFTRTELGTLKTDNGVLITPNQQVVYEREAATLRRSLVEKPALLVKVAPSKAMTFEDAPVVEVLTGLERSYGVDIVYDAELLKNCTLRASLYDEPLFDKLNLICKTLNLSYQVIDTQVVLTGRGCAQ